MKYLSNKYISIAFIFIVTLFLSTYKLTESPRTWMDEGIITQVSKNIAENSKHALQIAPNTFVSAGIVSTGFPVTFPISLSFKLFGVGIFQARIVMVIFILLLVLSVFFYLNKKYGQNIAFLGTLLVATFSPLYGNGKNVLGEVPGLLFLILLLIFIDRIFDNKDSIFSYIMVGIFAGLAFSTKSIFILLLPAIFLSSIWFIYNNGYKWNKSYLYSLGCFLSIVFLWMWIQFSNDSLAHILSIYVNPYSVSILKSVRNNIHLFVSELQPIYFLITFVLWSTACFVRVKNKKEITFSESTAFFFSGLVFLAFFRTPGHYRYFFLAQFISLIYLLPSLDYLFKNRQLSKYITIFIGLLIVFHTYETGFDSWVASYYAGNRSANISIHVDKIPKDKKVLIYQVPEFVIFLKNNNYYQFIDIATNIKVGLDNKNLVNKGYFDEIIINSSLYDQNDKEFNFYKLKESFDSYAILEKI